MAYEIPSTEPAEVTAGNLVTWKIPEIAEFLIADSWVLSYAFVMTGTQIALTATDDGDNHHLITVAAAVTAAWGVGTYHWQSYITNGLERYYVDSGTMDVLTDFAASGGYDGRSHWQIVLENVQAVLQNRATKDQSSYTISGRQLSRTSIGDLLMLERKAKTEVVKEERAERISNGLGHSGKILTRFTKSL